MQKNSFVLQTRLQAIVANLSDKQAGVLFKSILNYAANGAVATFEDNAVSIAFGFVRQDIDYATAKYEQICAKRKEAVQKRWSDTNVYKCNTKNTNVYKPIHNEDEDEDDDDILKKEKDKKEKKSRFVKPTVSEINAYCAQRNNGINAQAFFDFYESKGWKVGNTPMKDWRAAVRTWESKNAKPRYQQSTSLQEARDRGNAIIDRMFGGNK